MVQISDIGPLTEFQRNTKAHIRRLKATRRPHILTVNGKAALVVCDAKTFQKIMDEHEEGRTVVAIQQALKDASMGKEMPLKDAFASTRRKLGLP